MFIKLYSIALTIFIILDAAWLGGIAKNFYADKIGFLMKSNINWIAVIAFYLLFIAGLVLFVIMPAWQKNSFSDAIMFGAIFGLIAYATYDLTNLATIKNWPVIVTIVDLLWGAMISSFTSAVTYFIVEKLTNKI